MSDRFNICSFTNLIRTEQQAIEVAYELGLIPRTVDCPRCRFRMAKERRRKYKLGFIWVCNRRGCKVGPSWFRKSPLEGTFFENVHIPFVKVLRLIVFWYFRTPVTFAAVHCEVHVSTAVDFYSFCREVCRVVHGHDEQPIGGPGDIVEVDESHLFTPKYHRGRGMRRKSLWVFGGISRLTKKQFIVQVGGRDRNTLFPLMRQHIAQGSFIMSDEARVYRGCEVLGFTGHCAVNHSQTYVRPIPAFVPNGNPRLGTVIPLLNITRVKCHTNTLENKWQDLKNGFIKRCRSEEMIGNYISEYLYRRNTLDEVRAHKRTHGIRMFHFFDDIRRVYPGPFQIPIKLDNCECVDC